MTKRKNNEEQEKKPKVVMLDEYFNYKSFKKDFMTNTMLERLALELIDWATNTEDAIKIKQFLALKGIHEKTWFDWCHKFEMLKEAHDHAKMVLGNRRELGAMTRKFDSGVTNFMMPMYDKDWDDMLERRENLKKKVEELEAAAKIVIMEKFASVDGVPHRKDE